jgi:hypothetical protein
MDRKSAIAMRLRTRRAVSLVAAILAIGGLADARPSQASSVTLVGADFDVIYDPSTLGLFGTPQLIGDNLVFTPNAFSAQSLNGAGVDTVQSLASNIQLVADPGYQFNNLSVMAIGDYLMQGTGTSVGVSGSLQATDAARPLTQTTAILAVGSPLNIANGAVQNWLGSAAITNATPTDSPGYNPWLAHASTIDIQLADTLTATTTAGNGNSQAFIQEKFGSVELEIDPSPVPLPAAAWLMVSGLAALGVLARQKHKA